MTAALIPWFKSCTAALVKCVQGKNDPASCCSNI